MKIKKILFSPVLMGALLIIFAVSMAIATFIENDFGAAASYHSVYGTKWFELVLILLAINMTGQLFVFKLFRKEKLSVALFHLAFILMILGAGITRYFGWEGSIHIREGEQSAECYSRDTYIGYSVKDATGTTLTEESRKYIMNTSSASGYKKNISLNGKDYSLVLAKIITNAAEVITDNPEGSPAISLFVTRDMMSKVDLIIKKGEVKTVEGISIGFLSEKETDISITTDSVNFYIGSKMELGQMSMMGHSSQAEVQKTDDGRMLLKPMIIITAGDLKIVPQQMSFAATVKAVSVDESEQNTETNAYVFHIFSGKQSGTVTLWEKNSETTASGTAKLDDLEFNIFYGSKASTLPFALRLNDFILERYPGSSSPSGYKSEVTLIDEAAGVEKPVSIFMNNILKYKGYRFYQSSFDRDEKGTILSVNHDMAGMLTTYTGYLLLIIFIILSIVNRNSSFRNLTSSAWSSPLRKTALSLVFILILSGLGTASAQMLVADREIAEEFGKVLVQDQDGRTKPLFTLSNDIVRKVTRENNFEGYSSMQVFMGIYLDFTHWKDVSMISVSNRDLQKRIGITGDLASFSDLVNIDGDGTYKLSEIVNEAYSKAPSERNKLDKEVMKVDERVNIVYMIYQGEFSKLFPLKDGSGKWGTPEEALVRSTSKEDSLYLSSVMPLLTESVDNNNIATARQITESITGYQERFSEYDLPASGKTASEILYYKLGIFEKLFPFYFTIGLIMIILLIINVIRGGKTSSLIITIPWWILLAGYVFHTAGIIIRWYISGHAPMSNGYESMIFISWVTILVGFIFSRKSPFALAATAVLAGMTLLVAHMSFMDPQITNLVPVLKSYWLTLHVSVITGSYGFLGLGAILSIITMVLLALSGKQNTDRISATIDELTLINYRTVTLGLYFLTIGTFLGAVWANESWGRYWGWDPKETWSLITIIAYTFVTHSRNIPGLKDIYTFNLLSLFAFSSVLMTYFGVNYYLSGLHSYAGGDPVPVPSFVYVAVIVLVSLAVAAYFKYAGYRKAAEK